MKCLVTGVKGQLGYDIVKELKKRGINDLLPVDIDEMDITDEGRVNKVVNDFNPDVIFHCAAYTAVDKAEESIDLVEKVNVLGTKLLVDAAKKVNAKFIYISTDYVFDGNKEGIYEVDDKPNPTGVYGRTKLDGEIEAAKWTKHFIVRISWVFGYNGNNFVKTMLRLAETKKEINVVADQIGSPTYTKHLARLLVDIALTNKYGIYQATNEGYCSWYEFASKIFELRNIAIKVNPITTDKYPTAAKRPANSCMSKEKLSENGFTRLPNWEIALEEFLSDLLD